MKKRVAKKIANRYYGEMMKKHIFIPRTNRVKIAISTKSAVLEREMQNRVIYIKSLIEKAKKSNIIVDEHQILVFFNTHNLLYRNRKSIKKAFVEIFINK